MRGRARQAVDLFVDGVSPSDVEYHEHEFGSPDVDDHAVVVDSIPPKAREGPGERLQPITRVVQFSEGEQAAQNATLGRSVESPK